MPQSSSEQRPATQTQKGPTRVWQALVVGILEGVFTLGFLTAAALLPEDADASAHPKGCQSVPVLPGLQLPVLGTAK